MAGTSGGGGLDSRAIGNTFETLLLIGSVDSGDVPVSTVGCPTAVSWVHASIDTITTLTEAQLLQYRKTGALPQQMVDEGAQRDVGELLHLLGRHGATLVVDTVGSIRATNQHRHSNVNGNAEHETVAVGWLYGGTRLQCNYSAPNDNSGAPLPKRGPKSCTLNDLWYFELTIAIGGSGSVDVTAGMKWFAITFTDPTTAPDARTHHGAAMMG